MLTKQLYQHTKCVALGECGLDFHKNVSGREEQLKAFERQLELAKKLVGSLCSLKIGNPKTSHQNNRKNRLLFTAEQQRRRLWR